MTGQSLECERDSLANGASTQIDVPVQTAVVGAPTTRKVQVRIDAAVADQQPANDEATLDVLVVPAGWTPPDDEDEDETEDEGDDRATAPGPPGGGTAPPDGTGVPLGGTAVAPDLDPFEDSALADTIRTAFRRDVARMRKLRRALRAKGRAKVTITFVAAGSHAVRLLAGRKVVARGRATLPRAGAASMTIRATAAGRRLLRKRRPPRVQIEDVFRYAGDAFETLVALPR